MAFLAVVAINGKDWDKEMEVRRALANDERRDRLEYADKHKVDELERERVSHALVHSVYAQETDEVRAMFSGARLESQVLMAEASPDTRRMWAVNRRKNIAIEREGRATAAEDRRQYLAKCERMKRDGSK
jgi:hypothetical protein